MPLTLRGLLLFVAFEIRKQNHHQDRERAHRGDKEIKRRHGEDLDRTMGTVHGVGARGTMRSVALPGSTLTLVRAKPKGAPNQSPVGLKMAAVTLSCFSLPAFITAATRRAAIVAASAATSC